MSLDTSSDSLFTKLQPDNAEVNEIESLCPNCSKNGTTRLFYTTVPLFRELLISSFNCPHCGHTNRNIDPAAKIQSQGQRITLNVVTLQDLNRRVVRPSGSSISIPSLDADFPSSEGDLTTVEGVIGAIVANIKDLQPQRVIHQPELAAKLDDFIQKLEHLLELSSPFTIILDDPTGNAIIESLSESGPDPNLSIVMYQRSQKQDEALGIFVEGVEDKEPDQTVPTVSTNQCIGTDEVMSFQIECPNCSKKTETKMKLVDIPHFKQVVIMSGVCDSCGHRETEVKSSGGIEAKGRRHKLVIRQTEDLARDVIFSETAVVSVPSLQLTSESGSLGGRFSTVEGILVAVRDQLLAANPFICGDSTQSSDNVKRLKFVIEQLGKIASGQIQDVVFEIIDPTGNSYVQDLFVPEPDPRLTVEDYTRSREEEDTLGLTDMKTENYC